VTWKNLPIVSLKLNFISEEKDIVRDNTSIKNKHFTENEIRDSNTFRKLKQKEENT
jgi:hypothetical protein